VVAVAERTHLVAAVTAALAVAVVLAAKALLQMVQVAAVH
jgi:hypothetical protein